jgi:tellurite methyltransferase
MGRNHRKQLQCAEIRILLHNRMRRWPPGPGGCEPSVTPRPRATRSAQTASPRLRAGPPDQPGAIDLMNIGAFFDEVYRSDERYWWQEETRHDTNPSAHTTALMAQMTLRVLKDRTGGRALDLGAGEGADSIRLAMLGYDVDAVEISEVGAGKIAKFAAEANVDVNVILADVTKYEPVGDYDVIICNGVLHYIDDKKSVIERMQKATYIGGVNVISLWSTYTPVPECHNRVEVFCDNEEGVVMKLYQDWVKEFIYFERGKPEGSHSDMPAHTHSHIKLIARRVS